MSTPVAYSSTDNGQAGPSFESLLLAKIGSTSTPKTSRRQIQREAAVITSEDYLSKIKELDAAKKGKNSNRSSRPTNMRGRQTTNRTTPGGKENSKLFKLLSPFFKVFFNA